MSIFQTKDPVVEENVLRQKIELVLNRQTETLHQLTAITKELEALTKIVSRLSTERPKPQISEQLVFADGKEPAPVINAVYMASKRDIIRMEKLHEFMSGRHPVTMQTMMAVWACSQKAVEATLWRFEKDERYEVVKTKTKGHPTLYTIKEAS
tara:strand:- start:2750 stop:3208 length:459 start_codon:yes stop_codon:yes gene_type:complete